MSPIFQNRNVPCRGRDDTSAFGEGSGKTLAPGMVRSRFGGEALFLEGAVELFGRDDLRLLGLMFVNRVGQRFAIIQDRKLVLGIEADSDLGVAQSIGGALGLDLGNGLVK